MPNDKVSEDEKIRLIAELIIVLNPSVKSHGKLITILQNSMRFKSMMVDAIDAVYPERN